MGYLCPLGQGPLLRSPDNEDHHVLGSIFGPLIIEAPIHSVAFGT